MHTFWEKEFELRNFGFHHKRPVLFVIPELGPHALYPAWNAIQLIYHIIILAIDATQSNRPSGGKYFLSITIWAYLLLVLSNLVDLTVSLYVHCLARYILEERENDKAEAEVVMRNKAVKISYKTMGKYYKMRIYMAITWIFFTLSSVVGITSSLLHWIVYILSKYLEMDYNWDGKMIEESVLDFRTIAFTVLNCVVILLHLMITAKPFRLFHFYLPVFFFILYVFFNVAYQKLSGEYIYKILDWDTGFFSTGIAYGTVFIFVPLIHLALFGLVQVRIKIGISCRLSNSLKKWQKKKITPAEPEIDPDTNIMQWMTSNRMAEKDSTKISSLRNVGQSAASSRVSSARIDNVSIKSETSL
ncbi:uncharacterized protein LOC132730849 [Ruditapes philippinarum]|uniref:uncharacterized protein LOC132730849 n=1 Tax=Ruditapes philippinarum TaxID=129788 RepID=UPI00295B934E|nr:uncharacterized protein LOC132730849 [Ruditapes philippinarum]